ncbi:ABC transporter ATP-binding protein [Agromyces subbeticus]|uniref:ABC transporter ATP-binding protein n=1 Tax=Agromyces subbeticus TaxID=293890 RepID=UPI0004798057|nr:ABC transporter ATP-binding protein [Agromyces subbeticus]
MIEVIGASVAVDGVTMLNPVTLQARRGDVVAIRGANGSGKTTLLRLLTGQLSPSTGTVTVNGSVPDPREPAFRARIAGMIGLPPFARDLTLREHATLVGATWGWSVEASRAAAEEVLDQLGLARLVDRFPHELSSGQTQLAGLAVTLVRPSEVIVLDEPEQRLDQDRLGGVLRLLRGRQRDGATVIVATHDDRVVTELQATPVHLAEAA